MIIIKDAIKKITDIIGFQKIEINESYRPSTFTIFIKVEKGTLVYNSLVNMLILLKPKEDCLEYLIKKWFFVTMDFDEIQLVKNLRKDLIKLEGEKTLITYTIFTTTDCNARCPYCFEAGRPKIHMPISVAEKCAKYILNHYDRKEVEFRWFGGEPLYNQTPIDYICNFLHENNVKYTSRMATNGFLFNKNNIIKAKLLWNLTQVQITLDGTRNIYNKIKNYKTTGDGFEKVLNNIQQLADNNIEVVIRLNVDKSNVDNLKELISKDIYSRFANNTHITVYTHTLNDVLLSYSTKDRKILFKKKMELDKLIIDFGFTRHKTLPKSFKLYRCIADNKRSITILPSGNLGLCEHFTESKFIGNIDTPNFINISVVKELREYSNDYYFCKDCAFYPRCIRLVNCSDLGLCNIEMKKQNINNIKTEILFEYHSWLQSQTNN